MYDYNLGGKNLLMSKKNAQGIKKGKQKDTPKTKAFVLSDEWLQNLTLFWKHLLPQLTKW